MTSLYRLQLAYMHFNENSSTDKQADRKLDVRYVKYRGGRGSARERSTPPTFGEL